MPYTPSGGYYERKAGTTYVTKKDLALRKSGVGTYVGMQQQGRNPFAPVGTARIRAQTASRKAARIARMSGRVKTNPPKVGGYATLICFAHPDDAKLFHRYMVEYAQGVKTYGAKNIRIGVEVGYVLARATSVALHDCQKHPLNVKY